MTGHRGASNLANLVLTTVALGPFAVAVAILVRLPRTSADHMDLRPFLAALPASFLTALAIGAVTLLAVFGFSPALGAGKRSAPLRIAGLCLAIFAPPIVLVLVGALALTSSTGWQPWLPWLLQVVTAYPFVAAAAAIALEPDLRAIARVGLASRGVRSGSMWLALRLAPTASAIILMLAAGVAFQGYLINLLLRDAPQRDALVALTALFPHTGIAWRSGLLATLAIWVIYLLLSLAVSLKLTPGSSKS